MMKIAVLLTVFNRREVTLRGLKSLYKAIDYLGEGYQFDIYMTDDGCTDGTSDAVKKELPDVKIIHEKGNLFWNGGMRKAWQVAIDSGIYYDFYLWYNDDVCLFKSALWNIIQSAKKHKGAIMVGSMCNEDMPRKVTYGGRDNHEELITPDNKECILCDTFNGNLVLIPESVSRKIGINDCHFRHSLGDYDYGYRASKYGLNIYVIPEYQGICNRHSKPPIWCDNTMSLKKRIMNYYSPLGNAPKEHFYFDKKHKGLGIAILHLFSNHMRLFFPILWNGKSF